MIRVGVLGASGRMGLWVRKLLETEFSNRAKLGAAVSAGDDLGSLLDMDVVIDFSAPEAVRELAKIALKSQTLPQLVIGSTGWNEKKPLEELAKKTHVLQSSNFSTGVTALNQILKSAAPLLKKLGYTAVLTEAHHQHKKDAPSGTALLLRKTLENGGFKEVQTHAIRAGEVIGDHEISFFGAADKIVMGHFAQDRSIFARGAIEVALWLVEAKESLGKPQGILSMENYFRSLSHES